MNQRPAQVEGHECHAAHKEQHLGKNSAPCTVCIIAPRPLALLGQINLHVFIRVLEFKCYGVVWYGEVANVQSRARGSIIAILHDCDSGGPNKKTKDSIRNFKAL